MPTREARLRQLEKQLADAALKIYELGELHYRPMYPWVLVRVLPKEQKVGALWIPEKQERSMYEGIVLETWSPGTYTSVITRKVQYCQSQLLRGDRILFPHYEGMPLAGFDEKLFRLVREEANHKDSPNCGVFGLVTYKPDTELRKKLDALFSDVQMVTFQKTGTAAK